MLRPTLGLSLLVLALAAGACRSSPSAERVEAIRRGAKIHRELTDYRVIRAAHRGKVGYLKVYDIAEAGGPPYQWKYVYDTDWKELGFVDQFGGAYRYHYFSPAEQARQNLELRYTKLPAAGIDHNVMLMLGIDPATDVLTFPVATRADISGDTGVNLAGPGVVPAKAPTDPAAPAAEPK